MVLGWTEQVWKKAGVWELAQRALERPLSSADDLERIQTLDLLLLASISDGVRARHRGSEVRLVTSSHDLAKLQTKTVSRATTTGLEALSEVARARLSTPYDHAIAISWDEWGLELAQVALTYGADVLYGEVATKNVLPVIGGRMLNNVDELRQLVERTGRNAVWQTPKQDLLQEVLLDESL